MATPMHPLAKCIFRAAIRGARTVRRSGTNLTLAPAVTVEEWGAHRTLSAEDRDGQRAAVFPWATAEDTVGNPGELTAPQLTAIARRLARGDGDRAAAATDDDALDDALDALRALSALLAAHENASSRVTNGIRVSAVATFLGANEASTNVFAYRLRVKNLRDDAVTLASRHWVISEGDVEDVVVPRGSPGVVGQTPTLAKDAEFEYASGTELKGDRGTVRGAFAFSPVDSPDETFEAEVAPFHLVAEKGRGAPL